MREMGESEIKRLRETNERDRKDLTLCQEKITELERKKDDFKNFLEEVFVFFVEMSFKIAEISQLFRFSFFWDNFHIRQIFRF